jgi:NAD(P)-dependent dehydrogenase (short-subunit alcohol dehydrogenase family)
MAQGRIADRVAIISGGASGIGKATAQLFAQERAKVVIGDLPTSEGEIGSIDFKQIVLPFPSCIFTVC